MKRFTLSILVLVAALCALPVLAADAPQAHLDVPQPTAPEEADAPAVEAPEAVIDLEALLGDDDATLVCSCLDLCQSDAQCVFFYGPGSQCLPMGPCDCKECVTPASS